MVYIYVVFITIVYITLHALISLYTYTPNILKYVIWYKMS